MSTKKKAPAATDKGDMLRPVTGTPAAAPIRLADGSVNWDALTVNGQPIPDAFRHVITYEKTDQGMAEANVGKQVKHVEVVRSDWDSMLAHRSDTSLEPWQTPDPMADAVRSVEQPGMAYKFLSESHIKRKGMRRYEIARDAQGREVRVGPMVLGEMPAELKELRNRHYQKIGNDEIKNVEAQFRTDQRRTLRDAGLSEDDVLRPGEQVSDYSDPDRSATVGFSVTRGDKAA